MSFLILSTLFVVLAGLHVSEASEYVEVDCFKFGFGRSAVAIYTAPSKEGTTVNLMDGEGGILLHINYRMEQEVLVLNTKPAGGSWGTEQHVNDFYFPPGEEIELIAIGEDDQFVITANGQEIATYEYRLPVDSMQHMRFYATQESGSELVNLICEF